MNSEANGCLSSRNAASAVFNLRLHWRKFRYHQNTGAFQQWLSGVCAPQSHPLSLVRASQTDHLNCELVRPKSLYFCALLQISSIFRMFSSACTLHRGILTFIWGMSHYLFTAQFLFLIQPCILLKCVCFGVSDTSVHWKSRRSRAGIYFNVLFAGISPDLLIFFFVFVADVVEFP